jgi:hypothetical protein
MNARNGLSNAVKSLEAPHGLVSLLCLHVVVTIISFVDVALFKHDGGFFNPRAFHILYDPAQLFGASAVVGSFAIVSLIFVLARFSLGYFIGFYFYTMTLGYLWLNYFSDSDYDHRLAGFSAAFSAVAFLLPALLITSPVRQIYALSEKSFERIPTLLLFFAFATIVAGGLYNFRFVSVENIYNYRDKIEFPTVLAYFIPITSSVLLPFAFACFVARGTYLRAGAALLLGLLFYPVTLSKLTLFTPAWIVVIALLTRISGAKSTTILSLLLPILVGVLVVMIGAWPSYFSIVNFRMLAIPSDAMEFYNLFFSSHDLTHFCQIRVLKPLISCPYTEPLSVALEQAYSLGNYNASLFATEGIASVGVKFAPLSALACGLVTAFANRLSAGLPPSFIITSAAVLPQVVLNVPFSTSLLTHGMAALFLLWYITPRTMFGQSDSRQIPR